MEIFNLGSVGHSVALLGTIGLHGGAAGRWRGPGWHGVDAPDEHAANFDPALLNSPLFLVARYGTKVGLAPLHAWLPDAHAEGPTPISAVRCKIGADLRYGPPRAGRTQQSDQEVMGRRTGAPLRKEETVPIDVDMLRQIPCLPRSAQRT